jgi:hypothetical protein
MAQHTAVEWLVEKLRFPTNIRFTDDEMFSYNKLVAQAKEMEKQQIMEAYIDGYEYGPGFAADAEHYYTETYGK